MFCERCKEVINKQIESTAFKQQLNSQENIITRFEQEIPEGDDRLFNDEAIENNFSESEKPDQLIENEENEEKNKKDAKKDFGFSPIKKYTKYVDDLTTAKLNVEINARRIQAAKKYSKRVNDDKLLNDIANQGYISFSSLHTLVKLNFPFTNKK